MGENYQRVLSGSPASTSGLRTGLRAGIVLTLFILFGALPPRRRTGGVVMKTDGAARSTAVQLRNEPVRRAVGPTPRARGRPRPAKASTYFWQTINKQVGCLTRESRPNIGTRSGLRLNCPRERAGISMRILRSHEGSGNGNNISISHHEVARRAKGKQHNKRENTHFNSRRNDSLAIYRRPRSSPPPMRKNNCALAMMLRCSARRHQC